MSQRSIEKDRGARSGSRTLLMKMRKMTRVTDLSGNYIIFFVKHILPELEMGWRIERKGRSELDEYYHSDTLTAYYGTLGMVLIALEIEALRNKICYYEKIKIGKSVAKDLSDILSKHFKDFPRERFIDIVEEFFVVRDAVVHNHLYEIKTSFRAGIMLSYRERLLAKKIYGSYAFDSKYKNHVDVRSRKTKLLQLSVQPFKIAYSDVFIGLCFIDVLSELCSKARLSSIHAPYEFDGNYYSNLALLLGYHQRKARNKPFIRKVNKALLFFKNEFLEQLSPVSILSNPDEAFYRINVLDNTCPKCNAFAFFSLDQKEYTRYFCAQCDFELPRPRRVN